VTTAKKPVIKSRLKVDAVLRFGDVAPQLVANGYRPVPLHYGKKNPSLDKEWQHYRFEPKHVVGAFSRKHDGTGILTGEVVGLDVDVRSPELAAAIEALAETMLGKAPRRIGAAPKVLRVYRTDTPFAKIVSNEVVLPDDAPGAKKHKVEVLGVGQQFVTYNQHPDTGKPYQWNGAGDPLTVPVGDLVTVTEAQMREFIGKVNGILAMHAKPPEVVGNMPDDLARDAEEQAAQFDGKDKLEADDPAECRNALAAIPNEDAAYDFYIKIGHAVAGALGADGEDDWHAWAGKSAKYDHAKSTADWEGFMRTGEAAKLKSGAGTIYYEAEAAGWVRPVPQTKSLIQKIPAEWMDEPPPQQEWLADKLIPMSCVTAVLAEGAAGKSFAMLTLAEATAHGSKRWWSADDRALRQGGVVYVAAEDTMDIIRRRLFAIRTRWISRMAKTMTGKKLAEAINARDAETRKHLHLAPIVGMDIHLIDTTTGEVKQGPGVARLVEDLRAVDELVLVVLDPLSRLHGGDENSNSVSTALINAAERIAQEFGCAVIILHHVSKQAASDKNASAHAGRGGSALGDGARSVLRFLPVEAKDLGGLKLLRLGEPVAPADIDDGHVVRVVHAKNSYGPRSRDIYLLRDRETGELLHLKAVTDDRDGYEVHIDKLKTWVAARTGAPVTKALFKSNYKTIAPPLSRERTEALFEDAVARGVLVPDRKYRGKNPAAAGFVLAEPIPADTGGIPAKRSAGIAEEGEGGLPADTGEAPPSYMSPVFLAGIGTAK
jgi:hypothetical protein